MGRTEIVSYLCLVRRHELNVGLKCQTVATDGLSWRFIFNPLKTVLILLKTIKEYSLKVIMCLCVDAQAHFTCASNSLFRLVCPSL